ncbi:hypothetical protein chiPu_0001170 [Chiloscyllium punctatum]|uniref:Uncharacterized protein n=1 Tax=Chiloscyllium punctatum TaxID=137246 RepID=A0A401RX98_CHIPU|nr:hypothetical protein [Chiloscyllium punctatum]
MYRVGFWCRARRADSGRNDGGVSGRWRRRTNGKASWGGPVQWDGAAGVTCARAGSGRRVLCKCASRRRQPRTRDSSHLCIVPVAARRSARHQLQQ